MAKITVEAVNKVLDEIRPALKADGGNVEVLEVSEGAVDGLLQRARQTLARLLRPVL